MDQILFYKSFNFTTVTRHIDSHTDNSAGITTNYFARMHSGRGIVRTLDNKELHLNAGDIFFLPAGLRYHSYWFRDAENALPVEWESYGFIYLPEPAHKNFSMQHIFPSDKAIHFLDRLHDCSSVTPTSIGLLYLFLGEVLPSMKESSPDVKARLLQKANDYIRANPDFKVHDLAKYCGISESGLFSFFREYAHTTPVKLKQQFLTEQATELLCSTDRTVEDIAMQLGFCNSAHLRKTLKAITGKTPSEIRRDAKTI